MWIKICGITTVDAITAAEAAKVDAIGFVFAPSPRQVTPRQAAQLAALAPPGILRIAVTQHPLQILVDEICRTLKPDLFQTDAERRREMFHLIEDLRNKSCTVMMTSETDKENAFSSRHALIEYLADTVILLRYIRPSDLTDVHLALEVVKMRMSSHSREIKPYEIMQDQVMVYSEANVF
jgi:phosphoribosylanthranilate isomerase